MSERYNNRPNKVSLKTSIFAIGAMAVGAITKQPILTFVGFVPGAIEFTKSAFILSDYLDRRLDEKEAARTIAELQIAIIPDTSIGMGLDEYQLAIDNMHAEVDRLLILPEDKA